MKTTINNKKEFCELVYKRRAKVKAINDITIGNVEFSNKHIIAYSKDYCPPMFYEWERRGESYHFFYPVQVEYEI
jgi:hypothetical protein